MGLKQKLGLFIEKTHTKFSEWEGNIALEVLGVSNVDGITVTSHKKSNDLSNYLVIEPNSFAFNPYRINVGSIGLTPMDTFGLVSPAYTVFKVKEGKLIPELLLEFLKSFDGLQQINKYARGTVRKALRYNDLCQIELSIPSFEEQLILFKKKKIVDKEVTVLSNEIQTQKELLSQLKQAILQEAIQGKLTEDWRTRHPELVSGTHSAENLLKRIKEEKQQLIIDKKVKKGKIQISNDLGEFKLMTPSVWKYPNLNDITQYITDGTHQTPTYTEVGRMFLSAQNVKPFKFMPAKHRYVSEEAYQGYINNRKTEKGDLLLGRVGAGIGETAVVDQELDFAIYVSLGLIKTFKEKTNSNYLSIVFNSPYGVQYAKGNISSKGGSAGNFNLGRIRSFPIPFPPLEEQKAIVEKVEFLMQKCTALEQEINQSETNAKMLMLAVLKEAFES